MSATYVRGGQLVTMDGERRVIRGGLLLEGDRIVKIGGRAPKGARVVDATGCAVIPGLVQGHVHLCQALFRGMADDLPLLAWLKERIWPLEAAHDRRSLRASARLGLAEMIRAGTTCILDMGTVHHQDAVFEAMAESGIRGFSGKAMMDAGAEVPPGLMETTAESLAESHRLRAKWHGAEGGRLGYCYAPRFTLSCTEGLWREVGEAAREHGVLVHSHVAEHAEERAAVKELLGRDDVAALASYGVAGDNVVLAHGVQLRKSEMRSMAKAGTRVTHCPSANLKLASGIADVRAMRDAGMVVAIGADGAPCNNLMDPWTELREAALLAKAKQGRADALPAAEVFELATREGARALGLLDQTGSLEEGKKADLAIVDLGGLHQEPGGDVYSRLVYATRPTDVRHVWADGRQLVDEGRVTTLDEAQVRTAARREAKRCAARAGLG